MDIKSLLAISENIMSQPPVKEAASPKSELVDDGLKAVVVPDSYIDTILGFAGKMNEASAPKTLETPKAESIDEAKVLKEKLGSLVGRLKSLLGEAREVMQELTSAGCLGAAQETSMGMQRRDDSYPPSLTSPKKKKKKKYGSR